MVLHNESNLLEKKNLDILDYINIIIKNKLLFLTSFFVFLASIIVFVLIIPNIYSSTASIIVSDQGAKSLKYYLDSIKYEENNDLYPLNQSNSSNMVDIWVSILKSNRIKLDLIERLKLKDIYKIKTTEDLLELLDKLISVFKSGNNVIYVTVNDNDPVRASILANELIEELKSYYNDRYIASSEIARNFVYSRIKNVESNLEMINAELKNNGTFNLPDVKGLDIIKLYNKYAVLETNILSKEIKLQLLMVEYDKTYPDVIKTKYEIHELNDQMELLKYNISKYEALEIFANTEQSEIAEYRINERKNLVRDYTVNLSLLKLLNQLHETLNIYMLIEKPPIQDLDIATTNKKPTKPNKVQIFITLFIFSLFLSALFCFIKHRYDENK